MSGSSPPLPQRSRTILKRHPRLAAAAAVAAALVSAWGLVAVAATRWAEAWADAAGIASFVSASLLVALGALLLAQIGRREARLRESEARYRLLAENGGELITRHAPDGRIIYASPACRLLLGYDPADLVDQPARNIVHPDDLDRAREARLAAIEGNRPSRVTTRLRRQDDSYAWYETYTQAIRGATGEILELRCCTRDVSDRVQMESSLQQSERFFRSAFENAAIGMALVAIDGRLLRVNPALVKLLGYDEAELLSLDIQSLTHPEDLAGDLAAVREILAGQRDTCVREKRYVHKSGGRIWARLSLSLVRDEQGQPVSFISQVQDITEQKQAQQALRESERFAHATLDALSANVTILDPTGHILAVNRPWRRFAEGNGGSESAMGVGASYLDVCDVAERDGCDDARAVSLGIREVLDGRRDEFSHEYPCHAPDQQRWFLVRVTRFEGDGPVRVVVAHEDITERRQVEDRLRERSTTDPLTGLANRATFEEALEESVHAVSAQSESAAVLFLDLDRFKVINDSLGHEAGDRLLTRIAGVLRACVRADGRDVLARLGGDEFTVLLRGLGTPPQAIAQRILDHLRKPLQVDGNEIHPSASIGIVVLTPRYRTGQEVLRDADTAMYSAKAQGRCCYSVFDREMREAAMSRLSSEAHLREALRQGEIVVHYQPVVSLESPMVLGFEALVRWMHDGEMRLPGEFLAMAEETGLAVPLGREVLAQACKDLATLRAAAGGADPWVAINLSDRQLTDAGLATCIQQTLAEHALEPRHLKIEVTESLIVAEERLRTSLLATAAGAGVEIYLDDFGTGYSSIARLRDFPITGLKLDRSFARGLSGDRAAAALVHAVAGLAHNLDLCLVAEGVEQAEQIPLLQALECHAAQGYFFAPPMPVEQAIQWLRRPLGLQNCA